MSEGCYCSNAYSNGAVQPRFKQFESERNATPSDLVTSSVPSYGPDFRRRRVWRVLPSSPAAWAAGRLFMLAFAFGAGRNVRRDLQTSVTDKCRFFTSACWNGSSAKRSSPVLTFSSSHCCTTCKSVRKCRVLLQSEPLRVLELGASAAQSGLG